ncbi:MAG: glucose-1-phosphate thymidylyltransferase, partial [Muribaculaceae bacterium]|nr:glucose-1-phosphate thymidylyltransferase [Muribaculaceae bacterium]
FPRVFIPSFSEGSATAGFSDVPMKKFCDIAERVMQRRNKHLNELDRHILECIRAAASKFK